MRSGLALPVVEISLADPKLWSPRAPYLYDLECTLLDAQVPAESPPHSHFPN
jgi:beta-galactosidase/beta-glucuronidase